MEKSDFLRKTKHDKQYLIYLLLRRFQIEINKGNYHDANLVAQNLFWFYPEEQDARRQLENIYISKAEGLMREENSKEAEKALKSALDLQKENPRFCLLLAKVEAKRYCPSESSEGVRVLVHTFIRKYFPEELHLFDLAWRVFKDITPKDLTQEALSGGLGIVAQEATKLQTPKVIVLFNEISRKDEEALPDERVKEAITEIGRTAGCSRELIDKITEYILRG